VPTSKTIRAIMKLRSVVWLCAVLACIRKIAHRFNPQALSVMVH